MKPIERPKYPIFIAGPARSGTTLVRWAMDTHPNIVARSEQTHLLPIVLHFKETFLSTPVGDSFSRQKLHRLRRLHDCRIASRAVRDGFCNLHRMFYDDLCSRLGKLRWADSTHVILDRMLPVIDLLYDRKAQYLILTRHGLDVAASVHEKFHHTPTEAIDYWCAVSDMHLAFSKLHPSRCFRVRYETLVANADQVLNEIFSFLGEPSVPGIAEALFNANHGPLFGDHKIASTRAIHGKSVNKWLHPGYEEFVEVAANHARFNDMMASLGYDSHVATTPSK